MPTGTAFDSLNTYAAPASGNLAGDAAQQNIAAAGSIGTLSALLNDINHTANQNRVTGGAGLEAQSSQNIQNELAGNLPQSFLDTLQSGMAQRGASGGFGVDSANTNAAALRAMGLQTQQLQQQGQQDLTGAYNRAAPLVDASQFAMTPGLLQQQQDSAAQRALQAQAQANAQQEWQTQLASQQSQYAQGQAQQLSEYTQGQQQQQQQYTQTLQQKRDELAQQMGLSYAQMSQSQKQFVDSQAQQMTQWSGSLQAQVTQANQANALAMERQRAQEQQYAQGQSQQQSQFEATTSQREQELQAQYGLSYAQLQQQMGQYSQGQQQQSQQFAQTLAQQQAQQAQQLQEFGTTSGQNAAQLYAQTYHSLPGYNQYGAYTGQTGTYPGGTPGAGTPGGGAYNPQQNSFNSPFAGGYGWPFTHGG